MYKDPNSELVILKMTKTFSAWAELYDDTNSLVGKTFTVFGMGGQRGEQVTTQIENETPFVITNYVVGADSVQFKIVGANSGTQFVIEQSTNLVTWTTLPDVHTASENGCDVTIAKIEAQQVFTRATALPTTITNGWLVGDVDEKIRWGENLVDRVASYSNGEDQLVSSFTNPGVSTNECMLSSYDSGGGVFIKDTTGTWKLAGVNYASFSKYWWYQGLITEATLFDLRGMQYTSGTTTGSGTTASSGTLPSIYSSSYHTSTVNRVGWIRSIINP
jgi:hypothetical protein